MRGWSGGLCVVFCGKRKMWLGSVRCEEEGTYPTVPIPGSPCVNIMVLTMCAELCREEFALT